MEKYGFVYIWRDRKHNRYYVGCHWGRKEDGYICSSPWLKQAYKHRPHDFKRRILKTNIPTRKETYEEEQRWLNMIKKSEISPNTKTPRYYNLHIQTNECWRKYDDHVKSVGQKISKKLLEYNKLPEVIEQKKEWYKTRNTRSSDPEVREKRRLSMIGKNKGKDNSKARELAHAACRGKPLSEEHKKKVANFGVFRRLNNTKVKCSHCDYVGNPGNVGRYHNDNCKHKAQ